MSTEQTAEDPRLARAIDVILRMQRIENPAAVKAFMPQLVKDARLLLAAIDGPEPTWVDVVKAARAAGWQRKRLARGWVMWTDKTSTVDFRRRFPNKGVKATVSGPGGEVGVYDPTPAKIKTALGLVGLGGDSDAQN
jgi:hypothetical protein